jgi:hypothetical protein
MKYLQIPVNGLSEFSLLVAINGWLIQSIYCNPISVGYHSLFNFRKAGYITLAKSRHN